jgi:flagellar basal body-associated protein FliL
MTASATEQPTAAAAHAPAAVRPWKTIVFAAVALVAGIGVGTKVLAPRLRGGADPVKAAAAEPAKESGPPRMIKLDNLIVNPAGTQGAHFLIVSVGIEVKSAAVETRLHEAEVPLRDAVTDLLARKSMDQLAQPGVRDEMRRELSALAIKFAQDSTVKVYLPQFLIQ